MKLLLTPLILCFLFICNASCTSKNSIISKKDTIYIGHTDTIYVVQSKSIFGFWMGTYDVTEGVDAGEKGYYYSFELHKDSTIQIISLGGDGMTNYATGRWSLHNHLFSAHFTTTNLTYRGTPQSLTATYDTVHNVLYGTLSNDLNKFKAAFTVEKAQ